MRETGEIIDIDHEWAVVRLNPQGGCSSCHHSGICTVSGTAHREIRLPFGSLKLEKGDRVEIETSSRGLLSAAFMVFILPLIVAGAGFALVQNRTGSNGWATLAFFLAFGVAEGLIALFDRCFGRKKFYRPRIVGRQN